MKKQANIIAFDCGNSTIRTILCRFNGERIVNEILLSVPNEMIEINGYYYWDMLYVFNSMKKGLELASRKVGRIDSVGVCTWGIDCMLMDKNKMMLNNCLSYRNTLGFEQLEKLNETQKKNMFLRTGILCHRMNTVYILKAMQEKMPEIMNLADKLLMVPDILTYFLTGKKINEPSELSTTQLFDVRTKSISLEQCRVMGINPSLFNEIGVHGTLIGNIRRTILDELNIPYDIPVVCVPSHDTASAVLGIPCIDEDYLFVSSGTWALIGVQQNEPIINDHIMSNELTNELGAFGRITLLKNSTGMFITQCLRREYEREKKKAISWPEFMQLAADFSGILSVFDVNHSSFYNPPHMASSIWQYIHPEDNPSHYRWEEIIASVFESMAVSYAQGIRSVMDATGRQYPVVYIVGGGAKNKIINQRCADMLNIPVIACDMECASVGNAATQLAYLFPDITYKKIRSIITASLSTNRYDPETNNSKAIVKNYK